MRTLAFNFYFYGLTFVMAFSAWVTAKLGLKPALRRVVRAWGRAALWGVHAILGSRVEVRGFEHVDPSRSQLIVSKHQSELDIVMICALLPDFSAVAMKELEKYPFFGPVVRGLDAVMVRVSGPRQGRTDDVIAGGRRIRDQGRTMVIFPEGELMAIGAKERYRSGAGHLYETMGVEAVPVALSLGVIWPKREWRKFAGVTGAIEFMEPIPPGMERDAFMALVEERIEAATMRLIREHAPPDRLANAEERHARGATNHD